MKNKISVEINYKDRIEILTEEIKDFKIQERQKEGGFESVVERDATDEEKLRKTFELLVGDVRMNLINKFK